MRDDLGHLVPLPHRPQRVVSLVPSLTEAIALSAPQILVGATEWCSHPTGLAVTRIRGPKNPDLAAIRQLNPDLVVVNHEENRRIDVERLRDSGVPVWVTRIDSVREALASMARLFHQGLGLDEVPWLDEATRVWTAGPRLDGLRVAVPVWRDPWIWVGAHSYADDLLATLGFTNVAAPLAERFPQLAPDEVVAQHPDLILLADEPYDFHAAGWLGEFADTPTVLVQGRWLFWYGPAMIGARRSLEDSVASSKGTSGSSA